MKIGLVSSAQQCCPPEGYGAESATWDLAVVLSRLGHEVTLFAPPGSGTPPGGVHLVIPRGTDGVQHKQLEEWPVTRYLDHTYGLDVLHDLSLGFGAHDAACKEFSCGSDGPAHCCTLNGISYVDPKASRHNIILVSEAAREHADGRGAWYNTNWPHPGCAGVFSPSERAACYVVRYGRDETFYRPEKNSSLLGDYILYTGRPHPAKGIDLVLDLAESWPEQRFVLAWRAELPDHRKWQVEYLSRAKGLRNVEFAELPRDREVHHRMKRDWMARARVLLHPNVYIDACPVCPIETQLCGTPVVSWDRGGLRECCIPDRTAVLRALPSYYWEHRTEVAKLLRTMCREAFDLDRRTVREYALRDLTATRMAHDYLNVYGRILR